MILRPLFQWRPIEVGESLLYLVKQNYYTKCSEYRATTHPCCQTKQTTAVRHALPGSVLLTLQVLK